MKPNFSHNSINIIASIQKHFGKYPSYDTLDVCDEALLGKNHVIIVLLDGLGHRILEKLLPKDSFLRTHQKETLTAIFPPTTVAATTSLISGQLPGKTGWIGWHQYFEDINQHLVMFTGEDYYTKEKLSSNTLINRLPYEPFYASLDNVVGKQLYPSFKKDGYDTFEAIIDAAILRTKNHEKTITYVYWDYPDALMHEFGCFDLKVKNNVKRLNDVLQEKTSKLSKDTLVIVTADHGLADVEPIYLYLDKKLYQTLKTKPSCEGRATVFFVDDEEGFVDHFEKMYGKWFTLLSRDAFIKENYIGDDVSKAIPFLGDYIAIATSKYFFITVEGGLIFKAAHAGLTEDEMEVPLILIH